MKKIIKYFAPSCNVSYISCLHIVCGSEFRSSTVTDELQEDDTPVSWTY